jgi:hypothetical protein
MIRAIAATKLVNVADPEGIINRTLLDKGGHSAMSKNRKRLDVIGGAERGRTVDLLNAIQALSQLSYSPTRWRE